jgi:hypothetical protein
MMSKRSVAWNQSLSTAETGVEYGWNELNKLTAVNTNSVFMAGSNWTSAISGVWVSSPGTLTPAVGSEASTSYVITVNTNNWTITATGTASSSLMTLPVSRTVTVTVHPTTPFEWAILAKGQIDFKGNTPLVDSWNSDDGVYDATTNQRSNGTVGTDGSLINAGGLDIWGSMITGPNGTVNAGSGFTMNSNDYCRAVPTNTISNGLEVFIPSVSEPWVMGSSGVTVVDNDDESIVVSGNTSLELDDLNGDMAITGSGTLILYVNEVSIGGGDDFTITPTPGQNLSVIIYVKNDFDVAGNGIANTTGKATNLQIYCLPTCAEVDLGGTSEFVGALYAPDSDVKLNGNEDYYGSVIAKTVFYNGTGSFHYDEALDTAGNIMGFSLVAWHEQ